MEEEPEIFPVDADPMEPLPEPPGHVPEMLSADADPTELSLPGPALNHVPETLPADPDSGMLPEPPNVILMHQSS